MNRTDSSTSSTVYKTSSLEKTESLRKFKSYQYPQTHYNHLDESQNAALEEFKALCEKTGYYKPLGPNGAQASHDDETLLRYLRARKFVAQDALNQFKDTEDWRRDNHIDDLYDTIDVDDYDFTRKLYPQWTGRRDKRGIPLYVFEVAPLNTKKMAEYHQSIAKSKGKPNLPPNLQRLFALYENLIQFAFPLCSGLPDRLYPETPVSQSNNIIDISRVSIKQFWNLKNHLQDASQLATANYPETLDRIFIIGAPSFFPSIWNWIKRWFDPITVSKIFILSSSSMKSTLEQYIDPSNIPKQYGGTLDWEWGEMPNLDPEMQKILTWHKPFYPRDAKNKNTRYFPPGPVRWRQTSTGEINAIALGTQNGSQREEIVATLPRPEQGQAMNRVSSEDPFQSTTGTHTHPSESQEQFSSTGETPSGSEKSLPIRSSQKTSGSEPAPPPYESNKSYAPPTSMNYVKELSDQPISNHDNLIASASAADGAVRQNRGDSGSRKWTKESASLSNHDNLFASASATDDPVRQTRDDSGSREMTQESAQRSDAKDVAEQGEPSRVSSSYVESAKSTAGSAAASASTALGAVSGSIWSMAGYGKSQEGDKNDETSLPKKETEEEKEVTANVAKMKTRDVEDFIREKYSAEHKSERKSG